MTTTQPLAITGFTLTLHLDPKIHGIAQHGSTVVFDQSTQDPNEYLAIFIAEIAQRLIDEAREVRDFLEAEDTPMRDPQ